MLRVRLADGLRLELDGRELEPPRSRRARALLAWLALHPGMHARGTLAGRFWPDVLDESARASLRSALTELRAALAGGAETLVATREAVGLQDGAELWVDAREFERLLTAGRDEEAVATCAGELLTGIDDDWVHEARARHAERLATALERLAAAAERAGDTVEAIRRTRAAVALDPLAEEPNRQLIRRLAAAGDRAAAVSAYEQLAARLRTRLRIAPSAATRALVEEVRGAPAAPAGRVPFPATLVAPDDAPFVGRERELERMRGALAAAAAHRGRRLLLLAGEPGVGKTRLALEFARAAHADGSVVLAGRCSEEPLSAYEPFTEVLGQCAAALGGAAVAALAGPGSDELTRLLGAALPAAPADAGARHRLFDAVDSVLTGSAVERPLVLVIDDLHWADRPTLLLLRFLLRSAGQAPLVVVASYRDTELGRRRPLTGALAELRAAGALDRIALGGLRRADVAALAGALLGAETAPAVADAIHARTGGNAFFVGEVLRGLAERSPDPVPESVRHAVAVRLARLGDAADELLGVAAVLGLELDAATLQAVAGLPAAGAEAALDELLVARLLLVAESSASRLRFPHALVREAVYAELNALRRARLHRRAADVLIERAEDRHLEEIAHHLFEAAGPADAERAAGYLARAGERALAMLAYEKAAGFYSRALEALGAADGAEDPRAGPLLVARGDALLRAGEPEAARRSFRAAAALARRTGDTGLLARAALGHAGLGVSIVAVDPEAVAVLSEALEAVGESDPGLRSQLLARLSVELYYDPSRERSEALSAASVDAARASGDRRALVAALNARHVALWRPDRVRERLSAAEEMIAVAGGAGDRHGELQGRNWRAVDLFELGETAAWRDEVGRHAALADELRLATFAWYTPLWAAVDALHAGRFAEAATLRARAAEAGERAGDPNAELFSDMLRFGEWILRGRYDEVDLDFVRAKIAGSPAGMAYRASYAWLLAALGVVEEARAQLGLLAADRFSALPFDANWPSAIGECAEACVILGEPAADVADALYELLAPYAGRPLTAGRAVQSYGVADRHLAGLAALLGRLEEAIAHYERGQRLNAEMGLRPWVVHGGFGLARALAARGERERADAVAGEAAAEARRLGIAVPGPQPLRH